MTCIICDRDRRDVVPHLTGDGKLVFVCATCYTEAEK